MTIDIELMEVIKAIGGAVLGGGIVGIGGHWKYKRNSNGQERRHDIIPRQEFRQHINENRQDFQIIHGKLDKLLADTNELKGRHNNGHK